ncbi:hypothetical protein, partial [Xanthomonas citri]
IDQTILRDHRFKNKQSRKVRLNSRRSFTSKKSQVPSSEFRRQIFCNVGAAQLICHRSVTPGGSSHFVEKIIAKQASFFGAQKHITSMGSGGSAIRGNTQSPNRYADQYCNNDRSPVRGISMIKREGAKHSFVLSCVNSNWERAISVPQRADRHVSVLLKIQWFLGRLIAVTVRGLSLKTKQTSKAQS